MEIQDKILKKIKNKEELSNEEFVYVLNNSEIESYDIFTADCIENAIICFADKYFNVFFDTRCERGNDCKFFVKMKEVIKQEITETTHKTIWIDLEKEKKEIYE